MPTSILITREIPDKGIQMLKEKGYDVDVNYSDGIPTQKQLIKMLRKKPYDAVLSLLTDKIDAAVFDAAPSVKIFANYATGFDNLDLTEAKKRGIAITNAPSDLASEAVAEHTVALMFALASRIVEADSFARRGKYNGWSPMNFIGTDILGKTLGLIGAGRIGGRVAHYARGLGMKIIYTDVRRNDAIEKDSGAEFRATPEEILKDADIVSLHVPLLPTTHHLIDGVRLRMMKPTAFVVNTARGPIIDEAALYDALRNGIIAGAGLDVFEFEPKVHRGLAKLENVILTPHIASASDEARNEMAEIAANNIIDFVEGRRPRNIVNS